MKSMLSVMILSVSMLATPWAVLGQPGRPQQPAPGGAPASKSEEECKKRVEDLEKRVSDLQNRVKELMQQNEELRKAAGGAGGGGGGSGGGSSKPADKQSSAGSPTASPGAMFDALVKDYEGRFAGMPKESQTDQKRLMEAVRGWVRDQTRSMRGPVEWNVEVVSARTSPGARATQVVFKMLDKSGKAAGDESTVMIPGRFAKDMAAGKQYTIKATASAKPEFNADRTSAGSTNEPKFIGAYAEFGFDLEVAEVKEMSGGKP